MLLTGTKDISSA